MSGHSLPVASFAPWAAKDFNPAMPFCRRHKSLPDEEQVGWTFFFELWSHQALFFALQLTDISTAGVGRDVWACGCPSSLWCSWWVLSLQALYSDCFKAFFYLCRFFVSSCDFAHASIKSRGDSDNGALHLLYVISFGACEGLLVPLSVLSDSLWGVRQIYSTKNVQIQECKANWLKQAK